MYKIINGKKVYDEDISCVVDPVQGKGGIFIGNLQASENINTLKKHQIKAVLTSCAGVLLDHPKTQIPYYLYIPAQDHPDYDLSKHFDKAAHFIKDCLEKTNILVHCMAGISRSVSLVFAYMMKFQKKSYSQIYTQLKYRRSIIQPNSGFQKQLKKYENEVKGTEKRGQSLMNASRKYSRQSISEKYSETPASHIWTINNIDQYPRTSDIAEFSRKKVFSQYNKYGYSSGYKFKQTNAGNMNLNDETRQNQIQKIRQKYYYESTISSKFRADRNYYKPNPETFKQQIDKLGKKYQADSNYCETEASTNNQNFNSLLAKNDIFKKEAGKIRPNLTYQSPYETYQRNYYKSKM